MFIAISKQLAASNALLIRLSTIAFENGTSNLVNMIVCISAHINHHAPNAILNLMSDDKVDCTSVLFN